jgi:sortase A
MTMKNSIGKKAGTLFIICGAILIAVSLSMLIHNINIDRRAGDDAGEIVQQLDGSISLQSLDSANSDSTSDKAALLNAADPDREMPVVEIDGNYYIGRIDIPDIGISLPVLNEWSYPNLKIAPCLYSGTVYQKNMVIAAHNYESFFGLIKNLEIGSRVIFTDAEGNEYNYEVDEVTQLSPWEVDEMNSGDYPLTLFTCNYSGRQRVTVRCKEA